MKIIHCADMHLDSKMETNLTTEQASARRYEILATFERMVNIAVDEHVAVILIAGDMFDTVQSRQKRLKARVLDVIKATPQIDFLYLQGNHDHDNYFKELEEKPDNLRFFSSKWTYYTYENTVIAGVELGKRNKNIYSELTLNEHMVNIVAMHGQVIPSGQMTKPEDIVLAELQNKYIDYLALGHIHTYTAERLDYRGMYCYCGCLEGRGYDECGEKGFVMLEIAEGKVMHTFHPISKRVVHQIEVDVTGMDDHGEIYEKMQMCIAEIPRQDYVKIVLLGEMEEDVELDMAYMEQKIEGRFYTHKLVDKTEVKIDYRRYEHDITLKGEFIRSVNEMDLTEQEKSKVIQMGIHALSGKEIVG